MIWKLFSVKTLYKWEPVGKPISIDEYFNSSVALIEERVVFFKARSHDESINKAEKEASLYVKDKFINPYGQQVIIKRLALIDSYELYYDELNKDAVKSGSEVYSTTYLINKEVSNDAIINSHFGNDEEYLDGTRKLFSNRIFSGIVGSYEEHNKIEDD